MPISSKEFESGQVQNPLSARILDILRNAMDEEGNPQALNEVDIITKLQPKIESDVLQIVVAMMAFPANSRDVQRALETLVSDSKVERKSVVDSSGFKCDYYRLVLTNYVGVRSR